MNNKVWEPEIAKIAGLRPLTVAYLPGEEPLARRVLRDLRDGNIACALVRVPGGVEVWRDEAGYLGLHGNGINGHDHPEIPETLETPEMQEAQP